MEGKSEKRKSVLQMKRLETLTDVVYGIVLWRLFMLIPRPGVGDAAWESIGAYFSQNALTLVIVAIGLLVTIIYWVQSNALFGNLQRTDGRHTALSICQLFFLLVFLYSLRFGILVGPSPGPRAFESIAAAMVGLFGILAWNYAMKNRRLLQPDLSDEDAKALASRIRAEPLTALITIPFAFIGPFLWEIAWLIYPGVTALVKRRARARKEAG